MSDAPSESRAPVRTFVKGRSLRVWIGVLLLVCTLGARLPGALHYALWEDEVGAERIIAKPTVSEAVDRLVARESTPPTFYLMARVVDRTVSGLKPASRALAGRGLSLLFSLGCTLFTLVLAYEFLPLWAAALAGLLASFASQLVIHGSELRAYSLLAFACVAFAVALKRAVEQPVFRRLALLAGAVALGSMSHYFFLFTFAAGVLWLLTASRHRSVLLRVGGALAVGLIPLAVWLPEWYHQYHTGHYATAPPFSFAGFVELLPSLFVPEQLVLRTSEVILIVATLAILTAALYLLRRPGAGRLSALCVLVPFLVVSVLCWTTHKRVYYARNLIGLTPFVAIVLVWGCTALPWRRVSYLAGALVAAVVLAGFAYSQVGLGRTPYDNIADDLIAQGFRNNEPVLYFGSFAGIRPVAWYATSNEPPNAWPRIHISLPTGKPCRMVEVVVRTKAGRRWLARHRGAIVSQKSTPSYGDSIQGGRAPDTTIALLRWSRGILNGPGGAQERFRFYQAGSHPACLRP